MSPLRLPWLAAAVLLVACSAYASEDATEAGGSVNPTTFPFQQCVRTLSENRWRVQWHNYTEDAYNGSDLCFDLVESPLVQNGVTTCHSNKRCCATGVNKFKWYPAAACQRQVVDMTWKGVSTGAVYYEEVGQVTFIGKIVNLQISDLGPAGGTAGTLCFSLKGTKIGGTCPIFSTWMNPLDQPRDTMQIALYDHKSDNYECCPISQLVDPFKGAAMPPATLNPPAPTAPVLPPTYAAPNAPSRAVSPSPPPPVKRSPSPPPPVKASPPPPSPVSASSPPPPSPVIVVKSPSPPPPSPVAASPSPSPSPSTPVAVTSVYRNAGKVYTFVLQSAVSFSAAETVCAKLSPGGHLAAITTSGEMYNVGTYQRTKLKATASQLVGGNIVLWIGLQSNGAGVANSWTDGSGYNVATSFTSTHAATPWPPIGNTCVSQSCSPTATGPGSCNWVVVSCLAPTSGYICESSA